jgi:tetratricopeptide (TPR) repeat protein
MADACAAQEADVLKSEGNSLFKAGDFSAAAKKYREALRVHPSAPLYTNRAQCYVRLNKLEKAIKECERAIALDKSWVRAYTRMADCYIRLDKLSMAMQTLAGGLDYLPENEELLSLFMDTMYKENAAKVKTDMAFFKHSAKASCFCCPMATHSIHGSWNMQSYGKLVMQTAFRVMNHCDTRPRSRSRNIYFSNIS